jgi:hypothetical protein
MAVDPPVNPASSADSGDETSRRLFELVAGFRHAQLLGVAARLRLADLLAEGPRASGELAPLAQADPQALHRLLRGLVAIGLLTETADRRFALTPLGARLRTDAPRSLHGWADFTGDLVYRGWSALLHSVRTGETAFRHVFGSDAFDYFAAHPDADDLFNRGMASITANLMPAILDAYDFSASQTVVDVAGGDGSLLAALLGAYPSLRGVLFDLPHVLPRDGGPLQAAGVTDRCTLAAGDFFAGVPEGGDTYLLKSILHDWDDERSLAILKNCRRAMIVDSRLLLIEQVLPERVEEDPRIALSDLNMLVMTGGRERTAAEFGSLLAASGFALKRIVPPPTLVSLIEAAPV